MRRVPDAPMDDDGPAGEGFLQRWSRRKQEARAVPAAPVAAPADDAAPGNATGSGVTSRPAAAVGDAAPRPEPAPPCDADMPPLESLGPDSDVSAFFSPRVSESLRRAALRRLFHQPKFNVTDGLDDYDADYRHMQPLGKVVTADMRLAHERNRERLARLAARLEQSAPAVPAAQGVVATATKREGEKDHDDV